MSETAAVKEKGVGKAAIDVAKMDELKQLGWRTEKDGLAFKAVEINGDRILGPAASMAALHTLVTVAIGNKFELDDDAQDHGNVELEANSKGERYLPGAAPLVNAELTAAIGKYHAIKTERVHLTNQERDAKDELIAVCHIHEGLFVPDPDNSDAKIYRAGDLIARLSIKKEEKITTEIAVTDEV